MATQEGWNDFRRLTEKWQAVYTLVVAIKSGCADLDDLKTELILDEEKKSAMTAVGNQYPDHNMNSICTDVDRMIALSALLAANGY